MRPRNLRDGRGRARGWSCARSRHSGAAPGCRPTTEPLVSLLVWLAPLGCSRSCSAARPRLSILLGTVRRWSNRLGCLQLRRREHDQGPRRERLMVVRFVAGENAERPNARRFTLAGIGNRRRRRCRRSGLGRSRSSTGRRCRLVILRSSAGSCTPATHCGETSSTDGSVSRGFRHGCDHRRCRRSYRLPRLVLACCLREVRRRGDFGRDPGLRTALCCSGWCSRAVHPDASPCADGEVRVSVVVRPIARRRASPTPSLAFEELDVTPVTSKSSWSTTAAEWHRRRCPTRRCGPGGRAAAGPWKARRCGLVCSPPTAGRLRSPMPISPTRPISSLRSSGRSRWYDGDRQPSPRRHRHAGRHQQCARSGVGWSTWPRA